VSAPPRLRVFSAPIPFRFTFRHAAAERKAAENVIVELSDADGTIGLGEGCPRPYVTGETAETARAWLDRYAPALLDAVDDLPTLRAWTQAHSTDIDGAPAAFCALELALLDLIARRRGETIERLLGLNGRGPPPAVTAVFGAGGEAGFALQVALHDVLGMRDAKLKLSGRGEDVGRLARLARRGRVRVDANNLWPSAERAIAGLGPAIGLAWAVEEPVAPRDWSALADVAGATGLRIVLDESITRLEDVRSAPAQPEAVVNLRVSKHGGLLRTLALAQAARERNFGLIMGAQVGETSVLARAALAVAAAIGPGLLGYEAGYGPWLLKQDLTHPSLGIDRRGRAMSAPAGPGLGLTLRPAFARG
jgi:L-Ala-D/L-Glu epimerase